MTLQDIMTDIGVFAGVVGTIYAAITFHRAKSAFQLSKFVIPSLVLVVSLGSVAANFYQNSQKAPAFLQSWGLFPPATYQVTINSGEITQYKDTNKVMLIVRTSFSDVDRITDQNIEKSSLYTIDGGLMVLAHASEDKLKFLVQAPTVIEYQVAILPNRFTADQVKKLEDITTLGGRIIAGAAQIAQPKQAQNNCR